MKCRHCHTALTYTFLDLGFAPPSNAYLIAEDLSRPEVYFPLKLKVCEQCWLVQTEDYAAADELFRDDYAYFSSVSQTWQEHAARYVEMVIDRFSLSSNSMVIEIASNDGYLLKNFVPASIPCLGIEPTAGTAAAAEAHGIPVLREFFGDELATKLRKQGREADLIVANNVYAHVPDINDFTKGLQTMLKPEGVVTLEFPHLMRLIQETQFDTVYHEHFSYLSLNTVSRIFQSCGLRIFDVEELPTHGGSIRVFGCHEKAKHPTCASVTEIITAEDTAGLTVQRTYKNFQEQANRIKNDLLAFLIEQKRSGKTVAAYGAAAKGNTLLNYAGVKPDLLPFICDAAISKQGKFMPGSHIPILTPEVLRDRKPDTIIILPWNLTDEIARQLAYARDWGGRFAVTIPQLVVV